MPAPFPEGRTAGAADIALCCALGALPHWVNKSVTRWGERGQIKSQGLKTWDGMSITMIATQRTSFLKFTDTRIKINTDLDRFSLHIMSSLFTCLQGKNENIKIILQFLHIKYIEK